MQNRPIVIQLELRQTNDTLTGLITGPAGVIADFAGWLGLVAALDAIVRSHGGEGCCPDVAAQTPEGALP